MDLEAFIREAEALGLPCLDLFPNEGGDEVVAYWGGYRTDVGEKPPAIAVAIASQRHILSVDSKVWSRLGLTNRGSFALYERTTTDDTEYLDVLTSCTVDITEVGFMNSLPLRAVESISLPPWQAVVLYGGDETQEWLRALGLNRWEYDQVMPEEYADYDQHFWDRSPLYAKPSPVARLGGWHRIWPEDDFYLPREMRLMAWTFLDAEPWFEVFLSGLGNHVTRRRAT